MAEQVDVQIKHNKINVAQAQNATNDLRNNIDYDDGWQPNAATKNASSGAVFSSAIQPTAWQVRADYKENQDGTATPTFEIYQPQLIFDGVLREVVGATESGWNTINIGTLPLSSNKTLVARVIFSVETEGSATISKTFKSAKLAVVDAGATENPSSGEEYLDVKICDFYGDEIQPFRQLHTGILTLGGTGGATSSGANENDYNINITNYGDGFNGKRGVWLTQGLTTATIDGEEKQVPKRNIIRLDDLLYYPAIRTDGENCSRMLAASAVAWASCASISMAGMSAGDIHLPADFSYLCLSSSSCALLREACVSWISGMCASVPADETGQGSLQGYSASGGFFAIEAPTVSDSPTVYFYTELADANMAQTYSNYTAG